MPNSPAEVSREITIPGQSEDSLIEISEALGRILTSRTFRSAEGQRNFLRFAVEQTLAGRGNQLKEYTIGSEVFHRGTDFDPRVDNIVRAEARKLRARLAKFYETEGAAEKIRFIFPKGSYVPSILAVTPGEPVAIDAESELSAEPVEELANEPEETPVAAQANSVAASSGNDPSGNNPGNNLRWISAVLTLAAVGGISAFIYLRYREPRQVEAPSVASVAVLPFTTLGNDRKDDSFGDGLYRRTD